MALTVKVVLWKMLPKRIRKRCSTLRQVNKAILNKIFTTMKHSYGNQDIAIKTFQIKIFENSP